MLIYIENNYITVKIILLLEQKNEIQILQISRSRHRDHLDIFIRLKGNRTGGGRKKKARGHYTSLSRKENLNLMKLFSFRTLCGLTSHKTTEEFVETTEFRDGAEEGKGEAGANWFINWPVTQWGTFFVHHLVQYLFSRILHFLLTVCFLISSDSGHRNCKFTY